MDVLLIDRRGAEGEGLAERLRAVGCRVVSLASAEVDIIVLDLRAPELDLVEEVCRIGRVRDRPVVVFVEETDPEATRQALRSGVASYVVRGDQEDRLRDVLDVAAARHAELRALHEELVRTRVSLADRKVIERAKGLLMERGALTEQQAYEAMRKLAMQRSRRLADVARAVLDGKLS